MKISVPFVNDIPVNPVPAFQPYFTKNNLIMAGYRKGVPGLLQPERSYMGKKDIYTRPFMANKERFAELINVHIYQGKNLPIISKMEEEEIPMCKAFEELMIEQEELGMEKGMEKGDADRLIKSVEHVIEKIKISLSDACGIIGVTTEEFERAKCIK